MTDFEIERDASLRGWWIGSSKETLSMIIDNLPYKKKMINYENRLFIPDVIIREIELKKYLQIMEDILY